jgi:hypothetical protein
MGGRGRSRRVAAVLTAAVAALTFGPLLAVPPAPSQDPSETCFVCHSDEALRAADGRSVFVDPEAFAASVHARAGRTCVACHADLAGFEDFPHAADLAPVSCRACHPDRWRDYARGFVHGLRTPGRRSPAGVVVTVYRILTGLAAGLFLAYVAVDLARRRKPR